MVEAETPFDRRQQPALTPFDFRAALVFGLHLAGFTASTLLMTWGLFTLFFLTIGDFSLDGLMHQLHNLSGRYVIASSARVTSFKTLFAVAHLIVSCGLIVLRRGKILPPPSMQGDPRHG